MRYCLAFILVSIAVASSKEDPQQFYVEVIHEDYRNAAKGDSLYLGKPLVIKTKITAIEKDGENYVAICNFNDRGVIAKISIDAKNASKFSDIPLKKHVLIEAKCNGVIKQDRSIGGYHLHFVNGKYLRAD